MQRRTITLPDDLGTEIDNLVGAGVVPSVSRFFQDAARRHLDDLQAQAETPAEPAPPSRRSPWSRLA